MDCFSDCVIGVRGSCDCTEPESGLFIDYLGLNVIKADKISDGVGAENGEALVKQSVDFAITKVRSDLLSILDSRYQFNSLISTLNIRKAGSTPTGVSDYTLTIVNHSYYEEFAVIKIDQPIGFYAMTSNVGSTIVVSLDGVETQHTVNVLAGMNYWNPNIKTNARNITIRFSGFELGRNNYAVYHWNCQKCINNCENNCFSVYGVDANNQTRDVFLDLIIKCACDEDMFICNIKKELYLPIMYLTGINIAFNLLNSDRIDYYVTNSQEQMRDNLLNWNGGIDRIAGMYQKGEYWEQLKGAAKRIEKYLAGHHCRCFKKNGAQIVSELTL
jgi:hypothetical protein